MCKHLYTVIEIINIVICIHFLCAKKFKFNKLNILLVGINIVIFELINLEIINKSYIVILYLAVFAYTLIAVESDFKKAVMSNMLAIVITGLLQLLFGIPWIYFSLETDRHSVMALVVNASALFLLILLRKVLSSIFRIIYNNSKLGFLVILWLAGVILLQVVKIRNNKEISFEQMLFLIIGGCVVILLSYLWQKEREKVYIKEMELKMHEIYDVSFQNLVESIREKQHDFHNHLQALRCMHYTIHTYEELVKAQEEYCNELVQENRYYRLLRGHNPILSGFLYGKFLDADKRNIDVDYFVSLAKGECGIPEYVLVEMIGILLDNAIECVEEADANRQVTVRMEETEKSLDIEIGNPVENFTYDMLGSFFHYGRSGKTGHTGVGLNKVLKYRDEYGFEFIADKREEKDSQWLYMLIKIAKPIKDGYRTYL